MRAGSNQLPRLQTHTTTLGQNPESHARQASTPSPNCVPSLPLFLLADDAASVHLLGPVNRIWAVWGLRRLERVSRMGQGGT